MNIMTYTATATLALVAACAQPQPICDREAQEWNKFDTAEDLCDAVATYRPMVVVEHRRDHDRNRDRDPVVVDQPKDQPKDKPKDQPKDDDNGPNRHKGDNSDANGKGGNKHDRDDFTHGGTEVAEGKK